LAKAKPADASKPTLNPRDVETIRPGAGGHRFGPDLQCSGCGRNWDEHQNDPSPCIGDDEPATPEPGRVDGARSAPAPKPVPKPAPMPAPTTRARVEDE